ncbi:MAG: cell division topological specificity factor MinE [Anaerolineales bacterium]|nr:cell division topological specificity factor MinE [Anaerolineales bacterium]MCB9127535.1 cell division topological specificity factor MinE [Ardenticatenales bacterium]
MGFWDWLLGRTEDSRSVAKDRLKVVLVHDRAGISPQLMRQMQDEIIEVVSRYIDVVPGEIQLSMSQEHEQNILIANIPIQRQGAAKGSDRRT